MAAGKQIAHVEPLQTGRVPSARLSALKVSGPRFALLHLRALASRVQKVRQRQERRSSAHTF